MNDAARRPPATPTSSANCRSGTSLTNDRSARRSRGGPDASVGSSADRGSRRNVARTAATRHIISRLAQAIVDATIGNLSADAIELRVGI